MKTDTPNDPVLRPAHLARKLNCSLSSVNNWVRDGRLPRPITFGPRAVGWRESTINAWLAKLEQNGGAL